MVCRSRRLGDHPLQDAGVFPAGGDQVTVVVQEGNVGHVTAVATVLVARSLDGCRGRGGGRGMGLMVKTKMTGSADVQQRYCLQVKFKTF